MHNVPDVQTDNTVLAFSSILRRILGIVVLVSPSPLTKVAVDARCDDFFATSAGWSLETQLFLHSIDDDENAIVDEGAAKINERSNRIVITILRKSIHFSMVSPAYYFFLSYRALHRENE